MLLGEVKFKPIESLISIFPDYQRIGKKVRGMRGLLKRIASLTISKSLFNYDNIVIGSWKPYYLTIIGKLNKKGISPSILWCSTLGQTEMTWMIELSALNTILKLLAEGKIRHLFVPEKPFESLSHIPHVKYLPHPIRLRSLEEHRTANTSGLKRLAGNNCDLFMKARPGKNVLQQMLAQRFAKTEYTLHTNIRNKEILGIAEKLRLSFTHHSWLPDNHYYDLISQMDLSLQVTWTESFNYAVCERFLLGVPVLVSRELFWVSRDQFLRKYLVVENCDSPKEIAKKIDFLLENRNLRSEIISCGRDVVKQTAKKYNEEILQQLEDCF